jgi:hypothetical protein
MKQVLSFQGIEIGVEGDAGVYISTIVCPDGDTFCDQGLLIRKAMETLCLVVHRVERRVSTVRLTTCNLVRVTISCIAISVTE